MAEDDDLVMPEVPADAAVTDPVAASVEEPRDSGVDPDSSPGITSFLFLYFASFFCCHLLTFSVLFAS